MILVKVYDRLKETERRLILIGDLLWFEIV